MIFVVTAVALGAFARWAISRGAFDIRTVRVMGCRYGDPLVLLRVAAPDLGPHLFGDHDGAVISLERMPLIRRADIDRIPPDRIVIRVIEREPIALLRGDPVTPIDEEGWLLPIPLGAHPLDLPVIDPGAPIEADAGSRTRSPDVNRLLRFLDDLRSMDAALVRDVSVISRDGDEGVQLTTVEGSRRIRMEEEPSRRDIRILREVMNELDGKGVESCTIDLRFEGQVVVH